MLVYEMNANNITFNSFEMKQELNPKFWVDGKMVDEVKKHLLSIANDFIDELTVPWIKPKDIIITGSLANYNWSRYSDVDIHIIYDFKKVLRNKEEFVSDYFRTKREMWKKKHTKLNVFGFNVEISVEDVDDKNPDTGRYSLINDTFIIEPIDYQDAKINEKSVKNQALKYIKTIDDLEKSIKEESDTKKLERLGEKVVKLIDKLKEMRKEGLNSSKGEMSSGNICYKILRRTGHLDKIWNLIDLSYDKANSFKDI